MGLTIHYRLQADTSDTGKTRELVSQLRQRALDLPFKEVGDLLEFEGPQADSDQVAKDDPHRWLLIQAGGWVEQGNAHYRFPPTHLIAFSTWPGEGCEQANFGLCLYPSHIEVEARGRNQRLRTERKGWCWGSFCKSEYASDPNCGGIENFLRCHLLVIGLLDHAKTLGILAEVDDEGEYWEKRDAQALAKTLGEWNANMAAFVGRLKDRFGKQIEAPITEFPNFEHLEAKGHDQAARRKKKDQRP